jgi:hypothetical protein
LRAFVNNGGDATTHVLLFSLLYQPSALVRVPREGLCVVDRTAEVPGYGETSTDLAEVILSRIEQGTTYEAVHAAFKVDRDP